MTVIDVEKEKKNYERLVNLLNLKEYKKGICLDKNISQDTWNFGVSLGNFECSNKLK